jgi:hypothetical protein
MNQEQLLAEMERIRLDLVDPAKHTQNRTQVLLAGYLIEAARHNLIWGQRELALDNIKCAQTMLTGTESDKALDEVPRAMSQLYAK